MTQLVKNLPAMWETWVQSPGCKEPLEKEMATYSSILVWKIPWTEELIVHSTIFTQTVAFVDVELQIQRANYKVIHGFSATQGVGL